MTEENAIKIFWCSTEEQNVRKTFNRLMTDVQQMKRVFCSSSNTQHSDDVTAVEPHFCTLTTPH